jgi:hypothetical protein
MDAPPKLFSSGFPISPTTMIHITAEIVVIVGLSIFFYTKVSSLRKEVDELKMLLVDAKKRIEELEKKSGDGLGCVSAVSEQRIDALEKQTKKHVEVLYTAVNRMSESIGSLNKRMSDASSVPKLNFQHDFFAGRPQPQQPPRNILPTIQEEKVEKKVEKVAEQVSKEDEDLENDLKEELETLKEEEKCEGGVCKIDPRMFKPPEKDHPSILIEDNPPPLV